MSSGSTPSRLSATFIPSPARTSHAPVSSHRLIAKMKLATVAIVVATASSVSAQGPPPPGAPGDVYLGPSEGPNGWMGGPTPVTPPSPEYSCWYFKQPAGEWVNVCEGAPPAPPASTPAAPVYSESTESAPAYTEPTYTPSSSTKAPTYQAPTYSQTVVQTYPTSTETPTTFKTHPHQWHRHPGKSYATSTASEVDPWW